MESAVRFKEGEYENIDIDNDNDEDEDEITKKNHKNKQIFEQYMLNQSANKDQKNIDEILNNMDEDDRIYMIVDKDSGVIIDSRNEDVVAKLYNNKQSQISINSEANNNKIWKDFWRTVNELNYSLIDAAEQGDIQKLLRIVKEQAINVPIDINFKSLDNFTPMHHAAMNNQPEALEILIKHKGNLEAQSTIGRRPIHIAVLKGFQSVVEKILQYNGEINCQDNDLQTPLHFATERQDKEMIDLLLKNNAKTEILNSKMQCPYECTKDLEVIAIFKKYGVNIPIPSQSYNGLTARNNNLMKLDLLNKKLPQNGQDQEETLTKNEVIQKNNHPGIQRVKNPSKWAQISSTPKIVHVEQGKVGPQDFVYWKQLGKGAFGEVYLVSKDQKYYAMKILKKEKILKQKLQRYAKTEQEVLYGMNHPFITRLHYAFQTDQKLFLVLEYCPGGDLGSLLSKQKKVSEEVARIYVAEILLALEALHKNMIIYRDLKPENVILDEKGHAKLTDFGLAKKNVNDEKLNTSFLGTPAYFAPEIVTRSGHTRMLDWYNLGVLLYELLVGIPPFYAREREELYENIKKAPIKIPKSMSNEAKDLIKQLLNRNYKKRLGSERDGEEIREHPFFKDLDWNDVYNKNLKPPGVKIADVPTVPLSVKFTSEDTNKDKFDNWTYIEASDN